MLLLLALLVSCGESSVSSGKWTVSHDQVQKGHRIEKENQLLSDGVYASYKLVISWSRPVTTKSSSKVTAISDAFGQGSLLQVTYTDSNLPTLVQSFYIYPEKDYLLTEFTLQEEPLTLNRIICRLLSTACRPCWLKAITARYSSLR